MQSVRSEELCIATIHVPTPLKLRILLIYVKDHLQENLTETL